MNHTNSEKLNQNKRNWILIALMFTMMLAAMDTTIVSTAIPQIVEDLGDFEKFSWVFSIYLLTQTVTIPVYGKLADLYGRKPILLVGTSLFLLSSAACAAAWDMNALIIFRGIQGLGAGSIMATVNTLAGDLYPLKERGKIQGLLSSVWGMAAIIGPTLGGAFAQYASWQWIFLINVPIGIFALFFLIRFLHEQVPHQKQHIDFLGAILMLITGTTFIYTLIETGQSWPLFSLKGLGIIVLTTIFIGLTVYAEKKSPAPIMPAWIWKNKIILGCNLAVIGMGIILIGPNMYLPVFAQSVLNLGAILAGFTLAIQSLGWPISSAASTKLFLKVGFKNASIIGTIIIMLSVGLFILLPYTAPAWMVFFDQFLLGIGFGFLSTPTLVGIQSIVGWNQRGTVTGSNMFSRYLGQSIGAAIWGGIFNASLSKSIAAAPIDIKNNLPQKVDGVINILQSNSSGSATEQYLRASFYTATHHVYIGMFITGILIILALLILPKTFLIINDEKLNES